MERLCRCGYEYADERYLHQREEVEVDCKLLKSN